jgi:hypothetical protein
MFQKANLRCQTPKLFFLFHPRFLSRNSIFKNFLLLATKLATFYKNLPFIDLFISDAEILVVIDLPSASFFRVGDQIFFLFSYLNLLTGVFVSHTLI